MIYLLRCLATLLILALCSAELATAAPSAQIPETYYQPDDSAFTAVLKGDEWLHWVQTESGHVIARDEDGWWRYVSGYLGQQAELSEVAAHRSPPAGLAPRLSPPQSFALRGAALRDERPSPQAPPFGAFQGHVLFILVQFTDRLGQTSEADWAEHVENRLPDYFSAASLGKVELLPASEQSGVANNGVIGWLDLPYNHPNPGRGGGVVTDTLMRDAILAADPHINYAQYDSNGDGYLSPGELALVIIPAGFENSYSTDEPRIWGHRGVIGHVTAPTADGVILGDAHDGGGYAAFGELHRDHQATVGIIAHELGHLIFALPDLYDSDGSSVGIEMYGLMSFGTWGFTASDDYSGQTPVLPSAWSRLTTGWAQAPIADGGEVLVAAGAAAANGNNVIRRQESGNPGEYFLIENRQPLGYDLGLEPYIPGFGGLAIWHVDDNQSSNADEQHRLVDLEEADGTEIRWRTDLWYAGNATLFDTHSMPDSRRYDGADSGVSVSDISAPGEVMSFTAPIRPENLPPRVFDDHLELFTNAPAAIIDALANDVDDDGDALQIIALDTAGTLGSAQIRADNRIDFTPAADFVGADSFGYTVSDGQGGESMGVVTVVTVNRVPIPGDDHFQTRVNQSVITSSVLENDIDPDGDPLSINKIIGSGTGTTAGGRGVYLGEGVFEYIPPTDFVGEDRFTYTVTDGIVLGVVGYVFIDVLPLNRPPTPADDVAETDEDKALTLQPADLLTNDSDPDGDPLQIVGVTSENGAGGSAELLANGDILYTPFANFHGPDLFEYAVDDGQGGQAMATVRITVKPVNDPPTPVDDTFEVDEDQALTLSATDLLANDSDPDGDPLQIVGVTSENGAGGSAELLANGDVRYSLFANFHGPDLFEYWVDDGQGGQAMATVRLTVRPINDPPQAVDDFFEGDEDQPLEIAPLGNDSDVDGDALSIISFDVDAGNGRVERIDAQRLRYIPEPDFHGEQHIGYTISDGNGGESAADIALEILRVNDAPTAVDDLFELNEDQSLEFDPLDNDIDIDGDLLRITAFDAQTPSGGRVELFDLDRQLRYIPVVNFHGEERISYTVRDGHSGEASAEILLRVLPINDPPQAVADSATTAEEQAVDIDVLANDSDVDGEPLMIAGFDAQSPAGAQISQQPDGRLRYQPPPGFAGEDSFDYQLRDAAGATASATVMISVGAAAQVAEAQIDPPGGTSHQSIRATLRSDTEGVTLHYTLDGSTPTRAHGTALANGGDVEITQTATLRVLAWKLGLRDSAIASASFIIDPEHDADGDGVPDSKDPLIDPTRLQLGGAVNDSGDYLATDPGLRLRLGPAAQAAGRSGARVELQDLSAARALDDPGYQHEGLLVDVVIDDLAQPGDSARLVLPLDAALGDDQVVRLYLAGSWADFDSAVDALAGAPAANGCPLPGDLAFVAATIGASCLQLTLSDAGANDADGAANGEVRLLLSVARRVDDSPPPDDGGGGGGIGWLGLLALLPLLRRRLRAGSV